MSHKGRDVICLLGATLTRRQSAVLRQMAEFRDDDRGELVRSGSQNFVGDDRIASQTVNALLRACAISRERWSGGIERYRINETGLKIASDPRP